MPRLRVLKKDDLERLLVRRHGTDQREPCFGLQSPEETARLMDRGRKLAQVRRARRAW